MLSVTLVSLFLSAAQPTWHTDYDRACLQAMREKKDLLIYFREDDKLDAALEEPTLLEGLGRHVCLKVPTSYEYEGKRLLDYGALAEMMGQPGLAVISYSDKESPTNGGAISVHPLVGSHYHWVPRYGVREVQTILDLPATATLSQRSMIYAIRVHPERPQSVYAMAHPAFLGHAQRHSQRQASMLHQHHADIIGTSNQLSSQAGVGIGGASEVVAESWGRVVGGENVLEAAFSCVDAWRHSPGHWGAVSRAHRFFGYDIARGGNGTWYATGIFAD